MMIATFFGHRNTPQKIEPILRKVLIDLIENKKITLFYVGNHGNFDSMVLRNLKCFKLEYSEIEYYTVLAYMPSYRVENDTIDYSRTIYPEGLEEVPPRFSILKRNEWMVDKADCVVTYVVSSEGGAAKFKKLAEKKGKNVIELAQI